MNAGLFLFVKILLKTTCIQCCHADIIELHFNVGITYKQRVYDHPLLFLPGGLNTVMPKRRKIMAVLYAVLVILAGYIVIKCIAWTPGINSANGIASIETVNINGLDQSILIRGEDIRNPVLLYLHSGPGSTEMVSFRTAQKDLEKYFTVVSWDQRGTGKSYSSSIPHESMTISNMVEDTKALTEYLLARFKKDKIFLVGHSWGTALGLSVVSKYPSLYYAYIGSGQVVASAKAEKYSFNYALEAAKEAGNKQAIRELGELNNVYPYLDTENNPNWYEDLKTERKWLLNLGGEVYGKSDNSFMFTPALGLSEYTLEDFIHFVQGSEFSLKAIWPEFMKLDFRKDIQKVDVPVYFLQGSHDALTPSSLVEEYFNLLSAPKKELIWFDKSAHHPMYEEPGKYEDVLTHTVLPLAGKMN